MYGRPDMTFAVDWALSNNYLSIYVLHTEKEKQHQKRNPFNAAGCNPFPATGRVSLLLVPQNNCIEEIINYDRCLMFNAQSTMAAIIIRAKLITNHS